MILTGTGFLDYFGKFPARCEGSVLRSKVVASSLYSRIADFSSGPGGLRIGWPYHPGDWFHFGRLEDVRDIWEIPLAEEPELSRWFTGKARPANDLSPASMNRYAPEQYIWLSFLRKHLEIECEHQWDVTPETVRGTERSMAGNLVIVSPAQAGVVFAKYPTAGWRDGPFAWLSAGPGNCYTHAMWRAMYTRDCEHRRSARAAIQDARRAVLGFAFRASTYVMSRRQGLARLRGRAR